MRTNFNRDLNKQHSQELATKKRLEKLKELGLFNVGADEDDFGNVQFFDVTDGFDPELMEMLNIKIKTMRDKFSDW